jgi:hypothetical protein
MFEDYEENGILQILPAQTGWDAVFADLTNETAPLYLVQPLVCWALVKRQDRAVVGMVAHHRKTGELAFVDGIPGFLGYNYPGCTENWSKEVQLYHEREKNIEKTLTPDKLIVGFD